MLVGSAVPAFGMPSVQVVVMSCSRQVMSKMFVGLSLEVNPTIGSTGPWLSNEEDLFLRRSMALGMWEWSCVRPEV